MSTPTETVARATPAGSGGKETKTPTETPTPTPVQYCGSAACLQPPGRCQTELTDCYLTGTCVLAYACSCPDRATCGPPVSTPSAIATETPVATPSSTSTVTLLSTQLMRRHQHSHRRRHRHLWRSDALVTATTPEGHGVRADYHGEHRALQRSTRMHSAVGVPGWRCQQERLDRGQRDHHRREQCAERVPCNKCRGGAPVPLSYGGNAASPYDESEHVFSSIDGANFRLSRLGPSPGELTPSAAADRNDPLLSNTRHAASTRPFAEVCGVELCLCPLSAWADSQRGTRQRSVPAGTLWQRVGEPKGELLRIRERYGEMNHRVWRISKQSP